jgi:hypothetical protein
VDRVAIPLKAQRQQLQLQLSRLEWRMTKTARVTDRLTMLHLLVYQKHKLILVLKSRKLTQAQVQQTQLAKNF